MKDNQIIMVAIVIAGLLQIITARYAVISRREYRQLKAKWDKLPRVQRKNICNN